MGGAARFLCLCFGPRFGPPISRAGMGTESGADLYSAPILDGGVAASAPSHPAGKSGPGLACATLRTLLLLLYGAGLRISEALQLKETDVDLEERLLSVHKSKFFKSPWCRSGQS